ncbi:hypothetical protein CTA2_6578, partial [Colletotrichum tanaceti]
HWARKGRRRRRSPGNQASRNSIDEGIYYSRRHLGTPLHFISFTIGRTRRPIQHGATGGARLRRCHVHRANEIKGASSLDWPRSAVWGVFAILHALGHDNRMPLAFPVTRKKQRPAELGLMMPGHLGDRVRLALCRRHSWWTVDESMSRRGARTSYYIVHGRVLPTPPMVLAIPSFSPPGRD